MLTDKKGFSLIEILITVGLFALVMSAANVMMYTSMKNARKVSAVNLAKAEGDYAMKAMKDMIRYAKTVKCGLDAAIPYLTVERSNNNPTAYYYLDGTKIASKSALPSGTGWLIPLNSTDVSVTTAGCPNGKLFNCTDSNVQICFYVINANGVDVTDRAALDTNGIKFETYASNRNE